MYNSKYKVNKDFFKTWSNDMAYILGVIVSDGCVQDRQLRIGVNTKDYEWLKCIRDCMESTHPIYNRVKDNISILCIGSVEIVRDLNKLGVIKNKTYLLDDIYIPEKFISHFTRGYFDGDGSVTRSVQKNRNNHEFLNISFSCYREDFLINLKNKINKSLNRCIGSVKKGNRCFTLRYSGNVSCNILLDWMYKDANIKLERKDNRI